MAGYSRIRDAIFVIVVLLAPSGFWSHGPYRIQGPSLDSLGPCPSQGTSPQAPSELVDALITALSTDPDASVREHAATALGRFEGGAAADALADAVRSDPSARVREHAASALSVLCDEGPARIPGLP